jgi:hypothetical protein
MNATCPLCKYNILKGNEQVWQNPVGCLFSMLLCICRYSRQEHQLDRFW